MALHAQLNVTYGKRTQYQLSSFINPRRAVPLYKRSSHLLCSEDQVGDKVDGRAEADAQQRRRRSRFASHLKKDAGD